MPTGPRRRRAVGLAWAAFAVAAVVSAPTGAGATLSGPGVFTHYKGMYAYTSTWGGTTLTWCNASWFPHYPGSWWYTGRTAWALYALARESATCPVGRLSGSGATVVADPAITVPIRWAGATGTYDVLANWSMSFSASWNLTYGACPTPSVPSNGLRCQVSAEVYGGPIGLSNWILMDQTGYSMTRAKVTSTPGMTFDVQRGYSKLMTCGSTGACYWTVSSMGHPVGAFNGSGTTTESFSNVTLRHGHVYWIYAEFDSGVWTSIDDSFGTWKAFASGHLDLVTHGRGVVLRSLTIR